MPILTRKPSQTIKIGDDIEVFVVENRGDKVRLGFNAPGHVSIHRKEVYLQIQQVNRSR